MTNKSDRKLSSKTIWLIVTALVFVVIVIICGVLMSGDKGNKEQLPMLDGTSLTIDEFTPHIVSDGLQIINMGNYSGLYLEDGSDQVVSSVMMIVLENTSEKDLQLARIKLSYADFIAEFEATDIPAGDSVVLLERNRHAYVEESFTEASAENVVFFQENMNTMKETFEVTSGEDFVELKNIGDEDITGVTYVYYKNIADDTLYGGITYRATIEEDIPCGESVRVVTKHFTEKNTQIMQIVNVK